jgi:hypothetical protein
MGIALASRRAPIRLATCKSGMAERELNVDDRKPAHPAPIDNRQSGTGRRAGGRVVARSPVADGREIPAP